MKNVNTMGRLGASLVLIGAAVMSSGCSASSDEDLPLVGEGTSANAGEQEELSESRDAVIYGTDDRHDPFDAWIDPLWVELLKQSTPALVDKANIQTYGGVFVTGSQLKDTDPDPFNTTVDRICSTERFAYEVAGATCSGVLIDDDLVLTANHCLDPVLGVPCADARFVFKYYNTTASSGSTAGTVETMTAADLFSCQQVVVSNSTVDYAIVRLDRSAFPRFTPVSVDTKFEAVPANDGVTAIGFPSGVPGKITTNGQVVSSNILTHQMFNTLDAFQGNSGSGVYANSDHKLHAFIDRGSPDWVPGGGNVISPCYKSNICPGGTCSVQEEARYVYPAVQALCAVAPSSKVCGSMTPTKLWTTQYTDSTGWNGDPSYWQTIRYADLDGDGKADACGRGSGGLWCVTSSGVKFNSTSMWTNSFSDASGWKTNPSRWKTIQFGDLNGDGKADVCGREDGGMRCALSTGTSFGPSSLWNPNGMFGSATPFQTNAPDYETIQLADINGDGKADVCGRTIGGISCATSTGTSFSATSSIWNSLYSDFNGWNAQEYYWRTVKFPDVNGDGKADVCGRGPGGIICYLSSGSSFLNGPVTSSNFSDASGWNSDPSYWQTIQYVDINNDGRADVCGRGGAGIYCALSTGTSFNTPTLWSGQFSDANGWKTDQTRWKTIQFGDVNDDGLPDVCARDTNGLYCATQSGNAFTNYRLWTSAYSNANGWNSDPSYWSTVRLVKLDSDGKTDVCGRGGAGLYCGIAE